MKKFKEKDFYKQKIVEMVEKINNQDFLKFLYEMLLSFQKKWGI